MTSVPLGVWPGNLSSLAWVGIIFVICVGSTTIISIETTVFLSLFLFGVFVVDQLILGPLWKFFHK